MAQRIGVYPGTFDPVHRGHIGFAKETIRLCRLDQLFFIPETSPRNKIAVSNRQRRLNQINAMLGDISNVGSMALPDKQFTIDSTLPTLNHLFPNAEITLLIGSDVAEKLALWPNIATLCQEWEIAIGVRSGSQDNHLNEYMKQLSHRLAIPINYTLVHTQHSDAASSLLRNKKEIG